MKTLNEQMTDIASELSRTAKRMTKDSGNREINESTGFQRDIQEDKFQASLHIIELMEVMGNQLHLDVDPALETDFDMDGTLEPQFIDPLLINRTEAVLARGASKYGEWNWQRGNYLSRTFDSLFRHIMQWYLGDTSEDHLAAAVCNIMFLMVHERVLHNRMDFVDERGNSLGKHEEFADAGALFWDNVRYNMPFGAEPLLDKSL